MPPHADAANGLRRFLNIQAPILSRVRAELADGHKASHWMWFVFPQLAGLGTSSMARHYAITSREEAAAFLAHPVLGARLREHTGIVNALSQKSAREIFGAPDDLKFRSSMTLFDAVAERGSVFHQALEMFFDGLGDPSTRRLMSRAAPLGDLADGSRVARSHGDG